MAAEYWPCWHSHPATAPALCLRLTEDARGPSFAESGSDELVSLGPLQLELESLQLQAACACFTTTPTVQAPMTLCCGCSNAALARLSLMMVGEWSGEHRNRAARGL